MNDDTVKPDKSTYYTVTHPDEFQVNWKAFYDKGDELTTSVRKTLPHELDVPYGEDVKQRLDIYLPKGKSSKCPVFFFLHGGGFREGDRAYYGFVASPFAKHGIIGVVASYRLAPMFHYPAQPQDAHRALAWVYRNIESYGGDPERIFVGGHSAGAILAAFVTLKGDWMEGLSLPSNLIKGCAAISAPYDLRPEVWAQDYLPDPSTRAEASPILHVRGRSPRMVVAVGTLLRPEENMVKPSEDFARKLKEQGGEVEMLPLDGMNHADTVLALGDEQSRLFRTVRKMVFHE